MFDSAADAGVNLCNYEMYMSKQFKKIFASCNKEFNVKKTGTIG